MIEVSENWENPFVVVAHAFVGLITYFAHTFWDIMNARSLRDINLICCKVELGHFRLVYGQWVWPDYCAITTVLKINYFAENWDISYFDKKKRKKI